MKKFILPLVLIIVIVAGFYVWLNRAVAPTVDTPIVTDDDAAESPLAGVTFLVPGESEIRIALDEVSPVNDYPMGSYEVGASRGTLVALDEFLTETENGAVVPVAHNMGGSGEFLYLAVFETTAAGFTQVTNLPIGDRVDIDAVEASGNAVTVTYFAHGPTQAMAEAPNVRTQSVFNLGDLSTSGSDGAPSLVGTYAWNETVFADGERMAPRVPATFQLALEADGTFRSTTDCNQMGGEYTVGEDNAISFTDIYMTEMFCPNSQESMYAAMLKAVERYTITDVGTLELQLEGGRAAMVFTE